MERPEIKPNKRMFEVYQRMDRKYTNAMIVKVEFNCDQTEESHADANEYNGFHYDVYVDVTFLVDNEGLEKATITTDQFKSWFTFDPGMGGLWGWNSDINKVCSEWAKFMRCEKKDLEQYEKLKKKFE